MILRSQNVIFCCKMLPYLSVMHIHQDMRHQVSEALVSLVRDLTMLSCKL